jgi:hypothetical protein
MTIQLAQAYVGKDVKYMNIEGRLDKVREISNSNMILGYTDNGIVINVLLYKYKDAEGNWKDIA